MIFYLLAVLGFCYGLAFRGGYSLAMVHELLIAVASLVEHEPWGAWASVAGAPGP